MFGQIRWLRRRWRLARAALSSPDSRGLLVFLFHSLFEDDRELQRGLCYPKQGTTVGSFHEFVEALLYHGIVIQDLPTAIRQSTASLMEAITFDDGYAKDARALPTLERLNVLATYFISTAHVET